GDARDAREGLPRPHRWAERRDDHADARAHDQRRAPQRRGARDGRGALERVVSRDESDALHARVRAFIAGERADCFDDLALAIARFQARNVAPFGRLVKARDVDLDRASNAETIPAVPTDVFRLARVAAHPPEDDAIVFRTSGTTH